MNYINSYEKNNQLNYCISTDNNNQDNPLDSNNHTRNNKVGKIVPLYPELESVTRKQNLEVTYKNESKLSDAHSLSVRLKLLIPWALLISGTICLVCAFITDDNSKELLKAFCIVLFLLAIYSSYKIDNKDIQQ